MSTYKKPLKIVGVTTIIDYDYSGFDVPSRYYGSNAIADFERKDTVRITDGDVETYIPFHAVKKVAITTTAEDIGKGNPYGCEASGGADYGEFVYENGDKWLDTNQYFQSLYYDTTQNADDYDIVFVDSFGNAYNFVEVQSEYSAAIVATIYYLTFEGLECGIEVDAETGEIRVQYYDVGGNVYRKPKA